MIYLYSILCIADTVWKSQKIFQFCQNVREIDSDKSRRFFLFNVSNLISRKNFDFKKIVKFSHGGTNTCILALEQIALKIKKGEN